MIEGIDAGATLPAWLLYPATLLLLIVIGYRLWRAGDSVAAFALFALSFRYLASAHHTFTFSSSPVGLSWNALGSSAVFLLGILMINIRHLLLKQLIPSFLLIAVVVLSGVANRDIPSIIDVGVKFGYLVVLTVSVYEGLCALGEKRMSNLLLWAFLIPLSLQVLSIVIGAGKATEADGSASYIGGFNHEAAFSVVLATGLFVTCFATGLSLWARWTLLVVFVLGIVAANYRTVILAFAPLVVAQFNLDFISKFSARQRGIIAVVALVVSGALVVAIGWTMRDRFEDIATVAGSVDDLIKPQYKYTIDEKQLLSGRPYIWAGYIDAYNGGSLTNHLVGFGPDSWIGVMTVYAHNTLVSALYEYGVFGIVVFCLLWGSMFVTALRVRREGRGKLIMAHVSFFLLNMATMPHWMLEGNILYGVICGYTVYMRLHPDRVNQHPALQARQEAGGGRRPRPNVLSTHPDLSSKTDARI
jgi:hypothetical protein